MAGCGPCPDSCNCLVADEFGVFYPGSGDAGSPIIVPRAIAETVFAAGSSDGSIVATPAGPYGHTPDLKVNVCAILEEAAERLNGRLVIFSNDVDCKPERLRNPLVDEYLGFDPVSLEATWLPLPTSFSLTIDPAGTAPVSYGPSGLKVDCCPNPVAIVPFLISDTFEKADYPGLTAVKVRGVAGGGGAGGTEATGVGETAVGAGGGGGEYFEMIIPIASLAVSETVTIGAGGAAGASGGGSPGGVGGTTSFGAHVTGVGGSGGAGQLAGSGNAVSSPGAGGTGGTGGDLHIQGGTGGEGARDDSGRQSIGHGGASQLGGSRNASATGVGLVGQLYGGGGKGASAVAGGAAHVGAAGAAGVVFVETIY